MDTTTVVLAAVVFALAGTLVFVAIAPYLSEVDARDLARTCPKQSPDTDGPSNGCGPARLDKPH